MILLFLQILSSPSCDILPFSVTIHDTRSSHVTLFGPSGSDVCHLEAAGRASIGSLGSFPSSHESGNAPLRGYASLLAPQ